MGMGMGTTVCLVLGRVVCGCEVRWLRDELRNECVD